MMTATVSQAPVGELVIGETACIEWPRPMVRCDGRCERRRCVQGFPSTAAGRCDAAAPFPVLGRESR